MAKPTKEQCNEKYSIFSEEQKKKAEIIVSEEQLRRGIARQGIEDHFERLRLAHECDLPFDD